MLNQALQISLVETTNISSKLLDIVKPMPVFYPTEDEFNNPIAFVEKLMMGDAKIAQYGCIKIVPPKSF